MKEAELSLAVAKIMWTEYEWSIDKDDVFAWPLKGEGGYDGIHDFKYTTDSALGKMCVWLANRLYNDGEYSEEEEGKLDLVGWSLANNGYPHRSIAKAIVEEAKNDQN